MPDDDIAITEEEAPTVSAEEVLQYMEEHSAQEQAANQQESQEGDAAPTASEDTTTPDTPEESTSYYFSADPAFTHNDIDDVDKELFTEVEKNKVEITQDDKTMYLKAVLNDTPVRLDVPLVGGRISVSCRALTTQEKVVVPIGCLAYCEKNSSYPVSALGTLVQMARVAMQVTAVNGRPCDYVELQEPLKTLKESAADLVPTILDKVKDINSARYNYLIQALNVFEHKLARLSDAAFDQDFWDPAATD